MTEGQEKIAVALTWATLVDVSAQTVIPAQMLFAGHQIVAHLAIVQEQHSQLAADLTDDLRAIAGTGGMIRNKDVGQSKQTVGGLVFLMVKSGLGLTDVQAKKAIKPPVLIAAAKEIGA